MTAVRVVPMLLLAACFGAPADHERLGDEHYREGQHALALAEYRAALRTGSRARVWAKAGAAALRTGDALAAVEAYRGLAEEDNTRILEAARGLERAAHLARRTGPESPALSAALAALRQVAPERPAGRLAREAAAQASAEDVVPFAHAALAAAGGREDVTRLLVHYGDGLRGRTACEEAARAYRAALRRARDLSERAQAGTGLAACALQLGLDALALDRLESAEEWFTEAVVEDPGSAVGLRARLAWGDARLRQGDVIGAAISWDAVRSMPNAPDSLREAALRRISQLGSARRGDTIP